MTIHTHFVTYDEQRNSPCSEVAVMFKSEIWHRSLLSGEGMTELTVSLKATLVLELGKKLLKATLTPIVINLGKNEADTY